MYRVYLSRQGAVLVLLLCGSSKSDQDREIGRCDGARRSCGLAAGIAARRAEVGDKTLFKSLSESGNPTLETITKVLHAVGLRLSVAPVVLCREGVKA